MLLEAGLPDGFDVFHNVDWSSMRDDQQTSGELDAVLVAPSGHVMILEVKPDQCPSSKTVHHRKHTCKDLTAGRRMPKGCHCPA